MNRTGGQEDVNTCVLGLLESFPGSIDVLVVAPCEATNRRAFDVVGNLADRLEVAG